jgi:hypothetical protein
VTRSGSSSRTCYGPFAYYAYLPFAAILPPPPAVIATLLPAACFDALTLAGLHKLGFRLGGRPLAQAFMYAYLLYGFTALSLTAESNDALIAALCVWTIVAAERPAGTDLLIAAATLTKFVPGLLAVQFLAVRRGRARYVLALATGLAGMLAWPLLTSGMAKFLDSTFGYQLARRGGGIQFSAWSYLPHGSTAARIALAAALVALAISPAFLPVAAAARQHAALAAALLIGGELILGYWFYTYLIWFYPLLVVACVQPAREPQTAQVPASRHGGTARLARPAGG